MPSYRGYRFSPEIISHAVWLYHRFALSFRDVEDVLARRGVEVTYEAIRKWCRRFGPEYAGRLRRRRGRLGDTWHLDEVFVTIQGRQQYLWRAVDEDGDVLDILVQPRRNRHAAVRFFRKLLKTQRHVPRRLITDKLRSYSAACRTVMPSVLHCTDQYANNRAEVSHQPTGVVARIVTGPHDANRQDPHLPMRYDTGRPRAVIRFKISQPRMTSLPCPAGLRARRPSPMMDL